MWRTGVCTWTFGPLPLAEIATRLKFDGVELHGDVERLNPQATRRLLADHGLEVFSLTPANVDLAHPDPRMRRKALDYYARLIEFAAELGGRWCPATVTSDGSRPSRPRRRSGPGWPRACAP